MMRKTVYAFCWTITLVAITSLVTVSHAGFLDSIVKGLTDDSETGSDVDTLTSGLKEALTIGTKNAIRYVSKPNGYFDNKLIKILMPEELQSVADVLGKVGFQKEVDDFTLSMNRAAEKAAPKAVDFFSDAIKEMSFTDARKIFDGGDTAATEYFREKTYSKIYDAFKPIISASMNETGVTRSYKQKMGKYETIPFVKKESFDLDHYVTDKALEGLFTMVAAEEKKIRTDPAARVTDLLKTVFGD